jgi:hypothetical protein
MYKLILPVSVVTLLMSVDLTAEETDEKAKIHPMLNNEFNLSVGGFLPRKNIKLAARGSYEDEEYVIDFDETFKGGEREDVFAINFHWRFGAKWWLSGEIYSTRFEESAVLEEDKIWEGITFPVGSYATGGLSTDMYRAVIGREFYSTEHSELGIGFGLHWLKIGAFIEGEALVEGESTGVIREKVAASAPLPNLSVWYLHAFSPKWAAFLRVDWFSASIKEYSGGLSNSSLGVAYQFTDHMGLSLSYKHFELDVDVDKREWYGKLEYSQSGPFVALVANW